MAFKFNLEQEVKILLTKQTGTITGRAEYTRNRENQYSIHYIKDGNAVYEWFDEFDIGEVL